jgi:Cys-tRNA(Pro) deacylase
MVKDRVPATPAVHFLREKGVDFKTHFYKYERSGAVLAAERLGVDPHAVIKTLVMEDDSGDPLIVLMHGDRDVALKQLARELGVRSVSTASVKDAQRHTGYKVGGISPFGTRRKLPVYVEETLLSLPTVYINAGRRGFIVEVSPGEIVRLLKPSVVKAAI